MEAALYRSLIERGFMASPHADTPVGIQATLNERAKTHGDFKENGRIMQALKNQMMDSVNWPHLPDEQKEALQMIQHKIGRILSGNNNEPDHWLDISGYSMLVHNILETGKSHT